MKKTALFSAVLCAALLSACTVGPNYSRSTIELRMPAAFKEALGSETEGWKRAEPRDAEQKGEWWRIYGDETLNGLMARVEISNQNVLQYAARYEEAAALVREAFSERMPSVSGSAGGSRADSGSGPANAAALGATASWEVDLWGKLRRTEAQRAAQAESSAADYENAKLSARSSLAQDYFALRVLDRRIALYDKTIAAYEETARVMRERFELGTIARSDLTQAEQTVHSTRASREALVPQRAQYEHAIAVLVGAAPADFSIPSDAVELPEAPRIPAGIPSGLLERRPDIAAAERSVAAANEAIGIAEAAYFPDLTLTGSAQWSSGTLGNLIQADNFLWSLGASLSQTLFDFGGRSAAVEEAKAAYRAEVASYRQTVLEAMQSVEDALVTSQSLVREIGHTGKSLASATETARVMLDRYESGMIDYTNVSSVEAARLSEEQSLLSLQSDALINSVVLIVELGGAWEDAPSGAL